MSTGPEPSHHTSTDEQTLHKLGYAQELFRAMGGFQNFAISFTIISILAGCLTSYVIAYGQGGPVAVTWGWLIVGLMSTLVALSMAEIASAYPTAGGLYYWASKLGSPGWGWFTGWFNLVGQIAVTAAIGYGLAIFATALLNYWFDYPNDKEYVYLTYAVVLLIALVLNLMKVTVTAMLNTISAYWHMIGVGVVVDRPPARPGRPPVVRLDLHGHGQRDGLGRRRNRLRQHRLLVRLPDRAPDGPVHDHGLRRVGARRRGDAGRITLRGRRHVHVGRRIGGLRLHPARGRDARAPGRADDRPLHHPDELGRGDGPELGHVPALHLLRRADVLPDRVRDLGVADAVRVLARPRRPRASALAAGRAATAFRAYAVIAICVARRRTHAADALQLLRRLLRRHRDRGHRSLHRVHPAGDPALPDEGRVRAGRVVARQALQVDRPHRDRLGVLHQHRVPDAAVHDQRPVEGRLHLGGGRTTRRSWSAERCCSSAGGGSSPPTSGSRARCAWARRKSSSGSRRSRPGKFALPTEAR